MPLTLNLINYTSISIILFSYAVGSSLLDLRNTETFGRRTTTIKTNKNNSDYDKFANFFSYCVHIMYELLRHFSTSEIKLLIFANMIANFVILTFKSVLFFVIGNMRDIEKTALNEYAINYLLFKVVFIGAILEPDVIELLLWSSWFCLIGFFKMLAFVSKYRAEHHSVSPITTKSERVKLLGLLFSILGFAVIWGGSAIFVFKEAGFSTLCLLLFEPIIVAIDTVFIIVKYITNGSINDCEIDDENNTSENSEESVVLHFSILYYAELLATILNLSLKLSHFVHIWALNGLSLTLIDAILFLNMRSAILKLRSKLKAHFNYRNIVQALEANSTTVEEISEIDDVCAICLRAMSHNVKKLPCGHYYHFSCLCKWLERIETQPKCPVCRSPLLSGNINYHENNNIVNNSNSATNNNFNIDNSTNSNSNNTMIGSDTTTLSLNLTLNLNVEGQVTTDSEDGGRFSSILRWPSWLPTPRFSLNVTPTTNPVDTEDDVTADNNDNNIDNMNLDDSNDKKEADEIFSLADTFLSSPAERHRQFQKRKAKLLHEAR